MSVRALMTAPSSRTPRGDVERELLAAARHLGDGALGDLLEAFDVFELRRHLVDGRPRIDGALDERLLGADVELEDVELDSVGGRRVARELIEQVIRGRLGQRREVLAETLLEELRDLRRVVARLPEPLLRRDLELLVGLLLLVAQA